MNDSSTVDLRGRLADLSQRQAKALEEAGDTYDFAKASSLGGADASDNTAKFRALSAERKDILEELDRRETLEAERNDLESQSTVRRHPGHPGGGQRRAATNQAPLSPGATFVESDPYKRFDAGQMGSAAGITIGGLSFKAATFDTPTSTLTEYDRPPGIVLVGQMPLSVADLLAQGQTQLNTIRYMQETSYTNAATAVAEGATKPEATWATNEVDAPVRKIAVTSKVTDEIFNDFTMVRDYIDQRMRFMVAQQEEAQLLSGSGTSPNLRGILNTSGIQTQALGADTRPDAIFKGIMKVLYTGFFPVDGIVVNPTDWQSVRLLKDAQGDYIIGSPNLDVTPQLWGYRVVVTTAIAQGTALVGGFRLGAQIWYREGLRVESTNSNEDDFKTNKIAIRAEQREALTVYRPKAFCTVTGL